MRVDYHFITLLTWANFVESVRTGSVQLGPRPFWLVDKMRNITLKTQLGKLLSYCIYVVMQVSL